jgi:hypothetical protein
LTAWTGVLGATGSVGQRFILLLAQHPHFTLHAVGASERSAGKKYKDAVRWKQAYPMSKELGDLVVKKCVAEEFSDCDLIFSALDSDAGDVGTLFGKSEGIRLRLELIWHRDGLSQGKPRSILQRQKPSSRPSCSPRRPHCQPFAPGSSAPPAKALWGRKGVFSVQFKLRRYRPRYTICCTPVQIWSHRSSQRSDYASSLGSWISRRE